MNTHTMLELLTEAYCVSDYASIQRISDELAFEIMGGPIPALTEAQLSALLFMSHNYARNRSELDK